METSASIKPSTSSLTFHDSAPRTGPYGGHACGSRTQYCREPAVTTEVGGRRPGYQGYTELCNSVRCTGANSYMLQNASMSSRRSVSVSDGAGTPHVTVAASLPEKHR
ncbi:hypothetical protein Bbelb_091960 [Branchiostoma belcheri]|nr:hypothetical protein Bbelb_091960 [Branchiostoma belcheri]